MGTAGSSKSNKKMMKFSWSQKHKEILRNVLMETKRVLERYSIQGIYMLLPHTLSTYSASDPNLKPLDPKQRQTLSLNTVQIITLSIDSLINMVGGIKGLVSESCAIGKTSKRQQRQEVHVHVHGIINVT